MANAWPPAAGLKWWLTTHACKQIATPLTWQPRSIPRAQPRRQNPQPEPKIDPSIHFIWRRYAGAVFLALSRADNDSQVRRGGHERPSPGSG